MMQDQNEEADCSSSVSDQEDPSDCTMEDVCNHQAIAKSKDDRLLELESEVSLLTNAIVTFFQQGDRGIVDVLRQRDVELPEKWQVQPVQEKKQEQDPSQQERQEHRKDDAPCEPEKSRSKIVTAFRALACPGEVPDQSPNHKHLRCKIERLEREKEKAAHDISKLYEELDHTSRIANHNSRIANHNYKAWKGASRENHWLKQNIETLELGIENAQRETKLANRRASNATAVHQRLYQLLESAVVKRKDKAGQRSFPTGDDILSSLRISQKYAEDFFFDLVDLLIVVGRDTKALDCYFAIVADVLAPAAKISQEYHAAWVSQKKAQLGALIEDHNQFENPLTCLFMSATMQRLMQKPEQQAHQDDVHQTKLKDDPRYHQYPKVLKWALSDEVAQDDEMDGKSVESFFQDLVYLYGVCEFSDPPCYLYPPVGHTVPYLPDHHTQRISKTLSTKAKPHDSVRVLYPGLYYENPERNPKAKPVQKALVVCFNEPPMMVEGEKRVKMGFGNKKPTLTSAPQPVALDPETEGDQQHC